MVEKSERVRWIGRDNENAQTAYSGYIIECTVHPAVSWLDPMTTTNVTPR